MAKINFSKFKVYRDISHKTVEIVDIREQVANDLYSNGQGIAFHALAFKIYNSGGEVELDGKEYGLLMAYANQMCRPNVIDALSELGDKENDNT